MQRPWKKSTAILFSLMLKMAVMWLPVPHFRVVSHKHPRMKKRCERLKRELVRSLRSIKRSTGPCLKTPRCYGKQACRWHHWKNISPRRRVAGRFFFRDRWKMARGIPGYRNSSPSDSRLSQRGWDPRLQRARGVGKSRSNSGRRPNWQAPWTRTPGMAPLRQGPTSGKTQYRRLLRLCHKQIHGRTPAF